MERDRELAEIPARVAARERVVLRPSKRRKLGSFGAALWAGFMAAAGALSLRDGPVGLVVLVPAGLLFLYWLAVAVPRSGALTLDKDGFEVRHAWVKRRWDWDLVKGFGVRHIDYFGGSSIDLVSFSTSDPREQPGDFLQGLAVRGLTRTTTLPDRFGEQSSALAEAMSRCRQRFSDRVAPDESAEVAADLSRSRVANAVSLAVVTLVMTGGSLFVAITGEGAGRVFGWIGVALFGVGGAVGLAIRFARRRRGLPPPEPREIDADAEIATTAASSGQSKEVVARVLEAHYAFLERQPRGRPIDVGVERAHVSDETGLDEETVGRVFDAHDEFLVGEGIMEAPDRSANNTNLG